MKVAIGCDHGGLHLKASVKELLNALGHEVEDFGCHTADSCDYPDIAVPVANAVVSGQADRGILICGTGIGIGIAANKIAGIRVCSYSAILFAIIFNNKVCDESSLLSCSSVVSASL